ncbi:hypothetical protein ACFSSA_14190 [Luteolibacter algae]|uniref:Uncharacterized protein n=1 Tax=Luteolibacter algae TaxID=454151 RepID=A0ABW5D9S7_9BACT
MKILIKPIGLLIGGLLWQTAPFDCDLSLDVRDPEMKEHNNLWKPEDYYRFGLSKKQQKRILEA